MQSGLRRLSHVPVAVLALAPYRTFADWLNAARAKPGSLTLASIPAGLSRIAFEMLKRAANVDIAFIPYPGDAPAVNALLGGHVTAVFLPYSGVAAQLKAGKLRALASASRTRSKSLPSVPTVAESGFKGYEADNWNGLFAPGEDAERNSLGTRRLVCDGNADPKFTVRLLLSPLPTQ
jgi:tripartite-type tricarboxylate transporter receptor subunit TctC